MEGEDTVRATLERLIQTSGDGYAALSRLIGRNPAYIQQYLRRGVPRRLSENDRMGLARHFGVSETLLGAPTPAARSLAPDSAIHGGVEIPWLAASGAPSLVLAQSLLRHVSKGRHDWLAAHMIEGDSMAPSLLDGDHVLVDTADSLPLRDGLYAIESESRIVVKRLSINPATQQVAILSDNASYPSFPNCDPAQLRVIGRVVWLGRRLG
jgi:hypothetical protein